MAGNDEAANEGDRSSRFGKLNSRSGRCLRRSRFFGQLVWPTFHGPFCDTMTCARCQPCTSQRLGVVRPTARIGEAPRRAVVANAPGHASQHGVISGWRQRDDAKKRRGRQQGCRFSQFGKLSPETTGASEGELSTQHVCADSGRETDGGGRIQKPDFRVIDGREHRCGR